MKMKILVMTVLAFTPGYVDTPANVHEPGFRTDDESLPEEDFQVKA